MVELLCASFDVPLRRKTLEVCRSDEASLRQSRYVALAEMAEDLDWVALAHHRDDQVETVLMNLLRGCDIKGLSGMPSCFERHGVMFIRPFLDRETRSSIEASAKSEGLPWFEDPSNQEHDYARNRLRHRLLPLCDELYPQARDRIVELAESAQDWQAWLDAELQAFSQALVCQKQDGALMFERGPLQSCSSPLLDAWCYERLCRLAGGASGIRKKDVRELSGWIKSGATGAFSRPFAGDVRVRARKRELFFLS
jgi:tRNA(Ile)-lysidine synthase